MTNTECRSKNPATCPYHGSQAKIDSLQNKINSLFNKGQQTVMAPELPHSPHVFTATIDIQPITPSSKSHFTSKITADSHEALMAMVAKSVNELDDANLKPLKAGYRVSIDYPIHASEPDITTSSNSYNVQSVEDMKKLISEVPSRSTAYNEGCNAAIDEIRDTPDGQTFRGMKGVALMESMAKLKFFGNDHMRSEIQNAYSTIVKSNTSEYTNRGYGVRVHPSFDRNGELKEARFSLDREDDYGSFKSPQVNKINQELKDYFAEVDKLKK